MIATKTCVVTAGLIVSLVSLVGCGGAGGAASDEIIRVSRQNNSGTYQYFREAVLGEDREFKLGSRDQSGSKDVVDLVANTPNAIGYSGMGYATPEVKMLSVSAEAGGTPVAPTSENASNGTYPLARPLFLYVVGEPTGALKHYIEWIHSAEGQKVVEEIGYVPVEAVEVTDTANPPDGTIKIAGSDTMVNLAQAWAEEYMKKHANVDIQVSGGGSGVGIKALIDGTIDLADASREMKAAEKEQIAAKGHGEVKEYTVGLDALAIYVHKDNPLNSISLKELAEIYGDGGTFTNWSQLGSGSK
jgi:ABC-type phosphate transport system substrate-binding protein